MRKKKIGYILLTFLVVSGFAGTISNNSLSKKERQFAANHLKQTKSKFINSINGLSEKQLDFKTGADKLSIKECIYRIAFSETELWNRMEYVLNSTAKAEKEQEIKISDDQLISIAKSPSSKVKTLEALHPDYTKWGNISQAIKAMEEARRSHITYIKSTTDNMRGSTTNETSLGTIDTYQMVLLLSANTARLTKQIEEIKNQPGFPQN